MAEREFRYSRWLLELMCLVFLQKTGQVGEKRYNKAYQTFGRISMRVSEQLKETIAQRPVGEFFSYKDLLSPSVPTSLVLRTLSRFYKAGILQRLDKGLYYRPEMTQFGEVLPDIRQVVAQLLNTQKKQIAYPTGLTVFNGLGLTRQLSKDYCIATDKPRSPIAVGNSLIEFVSSRVQEPVSDPLPLQLLDALSAIKLIPDAQPQDVLELLKTWLQRLSLQQSQDFSRYALSYSPSTRALAGLLLDHIGHIELATALHKNLNSVSVYKVGINPSVFPHSLHWSIT